jgi:hypothetical protein
MRRRSLSAGLFVLTVIAFGCSHHDVAVNPDQPHRLQTAVNAPGNPARTGTAAVPATVVPPPQPDDAALLARKTAEYARNVQPELDKQPADGEKHPSIVKWIEPAAPSTPGIAGTGERQAPANQPASLAAAQLQQDDSVPMILPESADQIPQHPSSPATQPTPVVAASPMNDIGAAGISTDAYELKLQRLVDDYPRDLNNALDYQLLRFVRDEPTPEMSTVSQLSGEDRNILLAVLDGLNNFRNASRSDANQMLSRKIQPLLDMSDRLRGQAELSIPTVALCTQVRGYGVYTPLKSTRFFSDRDNPTIVYNEVGNFTSVRGSDSIWRTRLRQEMVLYTDTGLAVWPEKPNPETFVDQSRNRRHDFFISRRITLPSSLAIGSYVLKVTLTDLECNCVAEASTPLEIVASPDLQTPPVAPDVAPEANSNQP